jgi:hypothetical protein
MFLDPDWWPNVVARPASVLVTRRGSPVVASLCRCAAAEQKKGVHNVHTLGFGSARTGGGLGRIAEVFGGVAEIQGLEPGSSPTSGTHNSSSEGFLL